MDTKALEVVEEYNYMGQMFKLTRDNENEIKRRITLGWKAFGRQSNIMKSFLPICLKRKVYSQCVLPTMICGFETWKPTKTMDNKLRSAQRGRERSILGINLKRQEKSFLGKRENKSQGHIGSNQGRKGDMGRSHCSMRGQ